MSHEIHFLPDNVTVQVEEGDNLLAAAANAGFISRPTAAATGSAVRSTLFNCLIKVF